MVSSRDTAASTVYTPVPADPCSPVATNNGCQASARLVRYASSGRTSSWALTASLAGDVDLRRGHSLRLAGRRHAGLLAAATLVALGIAGGLALRGLGSLRSSRLQAPPARLVEAAPEAAPAVTLPVQAAALPAQEEEEEESGEEPEEVVESSEVVSVSIVASGNGESKVPGSAWMEQLNPGSIFCNASASVPPRRSLARSFIMSQGWRQRCRDLEDKPDDVEDYKDRDWCWAWLKNEGCLWVHGHWSWWEAQERLAAQGKAPDPHVWPMHPILNSQVCERPVLGGGSPYSAAEAKKATAWVVENVAMYVLNLPTATERWNRMLTRLNSLGLKAERVFGVDMTVPGMFEKAMKEGLIPGDYDVVTAQNNAESEMGGITGTVGVASAHFRALGTAHKHRGSRPLTLILEDDTELVDDFAIKLWRLLAEVPCDWAAISLKSRCAFGECVTPHLTRVHPDGNEPEQRCRHGVNYGFYAMLYRSEELASIRQKLRETVWRMDRPHCLDIDVALASISDEVSYYAVPAVQAPGFLREGDQGSSRYVKNSVRLTDMLAKSSG